MSPARTRSAPPVPARRASACLPVGQPLPALWLLLGAGVALSLGTGCPPTIPADNPRAVRPRALPNDVAALLGYAAAQRHKALTVRRFSRLPAVNSLKALEKARGLAPRDRRVLLAGAEMARALGERARTKGEQLKFARRGLAFTRVGREAFSGDVAFHYLHAALLGLAVDAYRASAMRLVPRLRAAAEAAVRLDRTYDHAGPLRVLGSLLVRIPEARPFNGDIERGTALLEEAVRRAPEDPLNHFLLAVAYAKDDENEKAAALYRHVICAPLSALWDQVLASRYRARATRALRSFGKSTDLPCHPVDSSDARPTPARRPSAPRGAPRP